MLLLQPDLFAFEILSGHLYLHTDLGSGPVKVQASKRRVDDGTWHDIALRRVERDGRVTVDGTSVEFRTPGKDDDCKYRSFFITYFDHKRRHAIFAINNVIRIRIGSRPTTYINLSLLSLLFLFILNKKNKRKTHFFRVHRH